MRFLEEEHDPASLIAFRAGFGALAALAALRFVLLGWVDELLLQPAWHFAWVPWAVVPSAPVLYGLFGAQVLGGLLIALGHRVGALLWLLAFGYVELLDKALYLNHYVLFTLLGLTLLCVPWTRAPGWSLVLLRLQVASVYVWAGLGKLNADWLLRAEPLHTWLSARTDLPLIGPLLASHATAYAMSWGGALYDLCVPFLLLHPRTRAVGVLAVLGFHAIVGALFPLGIFPLLMVLGASLLLPPSWPRRWFPALPAPASPRSLPRAAQLAWVLLAATILLFPARFMLWGRDVSWTERGYRFAWRVMLNEKTGLVDYRIVERDSGRIWRGLPAQELTAVQHQQLRTQPDLIRQYALHLAAQHEAQGRQVAVYADAFASLNGRPSQRMLRGDLDLTLPLSELEDAGWIHPLRTSPDTRR